MPMVEMTEEEIRVQMNMNEIALKAVGDGAVDAYSLFRAKYKAAIESYNNPPPVDEPVADYTEEGSE